MTLAVNKSWTVASVKYPGGLNRGSDRHSAVSGPQTQCQKRDARLRKEGGRSIPYTTGLTIDMWRIRGCWGLGYKYWRRGSLDVVPAWFLRGAAEPEPWHWWHCVGATLPTTLSTPRVGSGKANGRGLARRAPSSPLANLSRRPAWKRGAAGQTPRNQAMCLCPPADGRAGRRGAARCLSTEQSLLALHLTRQGDRTRGFRDAAGELGSWSCVGAIASTVAV